MDTIRLICSSPHWDLSGVNTFTGNLFGQFAKEGGQVEIVLTETSTDSPQLPFPSEIAVERLPSTRWGAVRRRHDLLYGFLVSRAPCIYFPNYDFNHVPVIDVLPRDVKVVLTAHSDEEIYYETITRYGKSANAIVAVSKAIEKYLRARHPEWNEKIVRIPYGVPIPDDPAPERNADVPKPLRVVYSGRITQQQKRIFDLVEVILRCRDRGLPVRFSLAGSGSDEDEVRRRLQSAIGDGTVRVEGLLGKDEMATLLTDADVVILTSDYEGLPLILLEAMARSCVPVVSRIASGIDEVIRENATGKTVPIGDIESFVGALAELANDRHKLKEMAAQAAQAIRTGPYNIKQTAETYAELGNNLCASDGSVTRRAGRPDVPIHYSLSYRLRKRFQRALLSSPR